MQTNWAVKDTRESGKMRITVCVVVFSFLLSTAISAPVKVKEDSKTMFFGDDFHIELPSQAAEVMFHASVDLRSPEVPLMRGGSVVSQRAKLNIHLSHLILDNVREADEGVYTVKDPNRPDEVQRITLIVRDCSNDLNIKYGDDYRIQLQGVTPPITLEYRPSAVEANQTSRPALVLLTSTGLTREGYLGRVTVDEHHVTLIAVTGADEGSYTVMDKEGHIKRKLCLNVKEHQNFVRLPYSGTLKINLIINSSMVRLYYTPSTESQPHLLLDKGELTSAQSEVGLEGRLFVDGSVVILEQVKGSDAGHFMVTDILGFAVSNIYLDVEPYRLPSVYVAVIALLGLLVFLLLVCLLSCLIKVKKRAKRAAALEKIAENAGKEDEGDAFRQVVKNITTFNEESKNSQADNTEKSQSTEVDIKGLEVSSKEVGAGNLETSDSGVGFNTTALPLDTDTDVPDQIPDSEAEAVSISFALETKSSPPAPAETKPSAPPPPMELKPSPPAEMKPSPVVETKPSPTPETKKTPDRPAVPTLDVTKPADDTKPSPLQSPEPKPSPSPVSKLSPSVGLDAKTPEPKLAPSPSPEPRASPKATSPMAPSPKTTAPPSPSPKTTAPPSPSPKTTAPPSPSPITTAPPSPSPKTTAPPSPSPKTTAPPSPSPITTAPPSPSPKLTAPPSPSPKLTAPPSPSPITTAPPSPSPKTTAPPSPSPKLTAPPSPSPKTTAPPSPSPITTTPPPPEPKAALTPTPEPPKPTTPEPVPISNGTPEPAPESQPSSEPADVIGGSAPKAAPAAKTPEEVELNSSSPTLEAMGDAPASNDGTLAEDTTTTTTT